MPSLTIDSGAHEGTVYRFESPATVVLGRGAAADLPLGETSVSRKHACIDCVDGVWGITDLASANGTFVNGRRVEARAPLAHGDALRIGSVKLTFEDEAQKPADAPAPAPVVVEPARSTEPQILVRVASPAGAEPGERSPLFGGGRRSKILDTLATNRTTLFDERALLSLVAEELLAALPQAQRAFVMLWDKELKRFIPATARTDTGDTGPLVANETFLRDVVEAKQAILVANAPTGPADADSSGVRAPRTSAVCAPILFQDDIIGVIQVDSARGGEPFTRADVALTFAMAIEVGMALSYSRLHAALVERGLVERDLALARRIQDRFLPPRPPEVPGYGFAVDFAPAPIVGGDLYDFIPLGGGHMGLAIGEVSGAGVAAALVAAAVMSDLRTIGAGELQASVILRRLNQTLTTSGDARPVTLALAVINPRSGRLAVASAGHPLPLVRDAAGQVAPIGHAGEKPLGVDAKAEFTQLEYEIDSGDSVVLFTDGVVAAANKSNEAYGDRRLTAALGRGGAGVDELVATIASDLRTFADGHPQNDDATIVGFDRK